MKQHGAAGRSGRPGGLVVLAAVLALASPVVAKPAKSAHAAASEGAVRTVVADSAGYGGQLALPIGGSKILRFNQAVGRVMVSDPKVADVVPLSEKSIYVLGKAAGASSLLVLPANDSGRPIAAMDLRVGFDLDGLGRAIGEIMPGEPVRVSAQGDGLVLAGTVSSSVAAARAVALAERYAPGKVVNLLGVRAAEQVMLKVHVAEVSRSALRRLGISDVIAGWNDLAGGPPLSGPDEVRPLPPLNLNAESLLNLGLGSMIGRNVSIEALFQALETKGYASTLAEPTLTALSGETAQFFAGGEFPVPVPQIQGSGAGGTLVTIDYKQYGVSVGFTPTVMGDTINLLVAPEVSALDRDNSVQFQGFRVPGLTTRRARTTVELRNGQSFAIAGLIRREFSDSLRGLPGAAGLPVFGALFRSTAYQNNESEVVIIVTAHLARPTNRTNLLLPTDTNSAPTGAELTFTGLTGKAQAVAPPPASPNSAAPGAAK